jgi:rhomboid protease GluP
MDPRGEIQFYDEDGKVDRPRRYVVEPSDPLVTYILIGLNVVMFGVEVVRGASPFNPSAGSLLKLGADFAPLTVHGEPWRLVTSMFLHFGIVHLAMNMVCLYQARSVELLFGRLGFIAIYFAAGLGGALASELGAPHVGAGASGAVFGVIAAFGVYLIVNRTRLNAAELGRNARWLATFFVINLAYGFSQPQIDITDHLGGIVCGALAALCLGVGARAKRQQVPRAIGVLVAAVGLSAIVLGIAGSQP